MADPDDRSEQLDSDVLGDDPFRDEPPGTGDYPPERSLGVEDPSLFDEDDLETRAVLRRGAHAGASGDGSEIVLIDRYPSGQRDLDESLTGEGVEPGRDVSPEDAAVHVHGRTDGPPENTGNDIGPDAGSG